VAGTIPSIAAEWSTPVRLALIESSELTRIVPFEGMSGRSLSGRLHGTLNATGMLDDARALAASAHTS
jgi:hypothetical protein